jgi:DNA-binding transcriptional MerR regulator
MHQSSIASEQTPPEAESVQGLSTIRELAKEFQVTLRALRFYEDRGLLKPRRIGQARLYDDTARKRLATILEGKRLGFTLAEIASMLAHSDADPARCRLDLDPEQVRNQIDLLEKQRECLERSLEALRAVHDRLAQASNVATAA